jgi:kinesin family member 11
MSKRPPSSRSMAPSRLDTYKSTSYADDRSHKSSAPAAETSIQVVVRTRRRSDHEIRENSPIIITSQGAKTNKISIETGTPSSTLGVVTLPPVRTYPFDLVFGPEADQSMVYHEVVAPMLEQVLTGFNCTLFAYGQTGTGKT